MNRLLKIQILDDDEHVLATLYDFLSYKNCNVISVADDLNDFLSRIYVQKNVRGFDKGKKTRQLKDIQPVSGSATWITPPASRLLGT
jgi:hypothetical protein